MAVETEQQRERFEGECHILKKYSIFNSISERLCSVDSASLNQEVSREFKVTHHLREDIFLFRISLSSLILVRFVQQKTVLITADCNFLLGPNINIQHEEAWRHYSAFKEIISLGEEKS